MRIFQFVKSICFCSLLTISYPIFAQQTVTIIPENKHQVIEFFGACDAWAGNFVGKYWSDNSKKQISDYLFSQENDKSGNPVGIGLSIWRVNLGGGTLEQAGCDIKPYHRRAESYLAVDGKSYDWGKCAGQEYFMKEAKKRGCNQFVLFSNSPLVQYTLNGKGYSSYSNRANLKEDCYDDYAKYLVDVTEHLMDKGYNIPYISPINEPQVEWVGKKQEGSPWRNSEMFKLAVELDKALSRSDKFDQTRIYMAETARLKALYDHPENMLDIYEGNPLESPGNQLYIFFDKASPYYIGGLKHVDMEFSAHPYHNHFSSEELRQVHNEAKKHIDKYGLDFHSSEWCLLGSPRQYGGITSDWCNVNHSDIQAALMMARIMHSDFVDTDAVSWSYWQGMELNGNRALVALHATEGNILNGGEVSGTKLLWVLGNFSRFIRPGYTRVSLEGTDDLDTLAGSAYISPDGNRIVAVFVNSSFEDIHVEMSFSKTWKRKPTAISSYRTDARHDLAKVVTGKGYDHTIAARGVTTVVLDFSNGK